MKKPVSKLNHSKMNCVNMVHTFNKCMQGCKSTKTTYYIEPQSYTLSIPEHALIYLLPRMTKLVEHILSKKNITLLILCIFQPNYHQYPS
uniref:Putative ovule protein n=1 Tax=Solanum chacoense TaxID=4108 RepID=A0A0V0GP62_SOLCH